MILEVKVGDKGSQGEQMRAAGYIWCVQALIQFLWAGLFKSALEGRAILGQQTQTCEIGWI